MNDSRRYDDDEVREIFRRATEVDEPEAEGGRRSSSPGTEGITLAELQDIGLEAGIDPGHVARAARALDRPSPEVGAVAPTVRYAGVPVSVGRIVELPARLTDEAWDRLVVHLRDVFHARGKVTREGSLRSWSNGNLQILLEPAANGYRLRMRSLSGRIRTRISIGGMITAWVAVMLVVKVVSGAGVSFAELAAGLLLAGGAGGGVVALAAFQSKSWRARRDAQFKEIGALACELAAAPDPTQLPPATE